MADVPLLHVHGPDHWHAPAIILGNVLALTALRDALTEALSFGSGGASAFTGDGEGFDLIVVRETNEAAWNLARLPYTDAAAADLRPDAVHPQDRPESRAVTAALAAFRTSRANSS